ncbi:polyphosphate kinase 1 [Paenibacillus sp. PsM32]|uniref:Polyphosphate kinase n=1 Tax=Paenibacillus kyungheensis TaxID=1452732 RepID=A0AAX3M3D5_9BACL|nr:MULTISPECIES: polyphosphate kinase 1 [Paenibacillus]MDN4617584.1 polyphosphate kinase 1 [Paenibacillus sp. PsM32]MDQ1232568.1 polyphosphate kinase [Paenibacillus sp. SORGH_AS_0306]MDR6109618.1 polyphosphate kinase [Paenibacillus sp. SORGH_AS_0338]WCT56622.1 polyphosphate kinase 1 [Paenibacillus kyungheensis]WDF50279.1 polyphosphate kinase 1 [Paenibacillus sp. KACC 21273]
MENKHVNHPTHSSYINRDLSWIEFNSRVLEEAQDSEAPLLERIKFLGIVSRNLDEFMSVRVAGIRNQIKEGYLKKDFTGYTPSGLFKRLTKKVEKMVHTQYRTYRELMRLLGKQGITVNRYTDLSATQRKAADTYYEDVIFPVLTPMAVDQSRPFPLVHGLNVYLSVVLEHGGREPITEDEHDAFYFAIVQIPSNLPRLVALPHRQNSKKQQYIMIDELICHHIHTLFGGYQPVGVNAFRLTRNTDLDINEEEAEDLLEEIENKLRKRRRGAPVRLEVEKDFHPFALRMLQEEFDVSEAVYEIDGPLDLGFLLPFSDSVQNHESLRYPPEIPRYAPEFPEGSDTDFFSVLKERDVLLYHPYESFDVISDFIEQAAEDDDVMAIKMTLYRVSGRSSIIQALAKAAESGKQVTVVVELKARFDEERNIAWARTLEKAGCHVVYGLVGLKTHAKLILVVRREADGLKRYIHIGTGNYNASTAKSYTDIGLLTMNPHIGEDASEVFNHITGYTESHEWQAVAVAPDTMMNKFIELIQREAEHARNGRPARIIAKMNSLSNQQIIDELYIASQAGVNIDLIIRGVCCLRPGVVGLSERITVRSIVDRYLEHSRIYSFENGGDLEIWLSSADWMTRNLTRRVELMCPLFDKSTKATMQRILDLILADNIKARLLLPSGSYERFDNGKPPLRSQFKAWEINSWKPYVPPVSLSRPTPSPNL